MSKIYDIILKNGTIVDPIHHPNGEIQDLAIKDGKIECIGKGLMESRAKEIFDVKGHYVLPGLIDIHTHVSAWLGGKYGHEMLARAGITTALDMSGPVESVLELARDYGCGLNIGTIEYLRPGFTISGSDPSLSELQQVLIMALEKGSIGLKILGGHYPLSPNATAEAIRVANKNRVYIAFHVGTSNKGSDIEGFQEAIELADGKPLHIVHINSYCRGVHQPYMLETEKAISSLIKNPNIIADSYVSPYNGTSARCSFGLPESNVTKKCLIIGGYEPTGDGLEAAILAGWAKVNMESGQEMIMVSGGKAVSYWKSKKTNTTVSFLVNPPEPRIRLITAKRETGEFVVDCISSDGGGIPRNVIIEMGISLVKLKALTMNDFVMKASVKPAQILGLHKKGKLTTKADADITVLNFEKQKAELSMVNGKIVMYRGYVYGSKSNIITTSLGEQYIRSKGLEPIIIDLANSNFYG